MQVSMTLGIVVEKRDTTNGPWQVVTVDGLLAHRQFGRLLIAQVRTECPVYTLAAPSAMAELLRGGWSDVPTCTPLQEGTGLPMDVSAAVRRDVEALASPDRGAAGWFTCARLHAYPWNSGKRELLDDDSWAHEAFSPELRQETEHLAGTLASLGEPANVRIIMFFA